MVDSAARDTDEQLVARVQKGDKRSFDLLVLKYQHKVLALVRRYVKDHAEAEDVAQESFVKAYRAIASFRGDSAFYTWLYRIAVNTAKNTLDARKRRPASDIDIDEVEDYAFSDALRVEENPENLLATQDLHRVVEETLAGLPEELRRALMLREFDGLAYEEIAEVMECPIGTVRSRIFRAREAIDEAIRPLLEA
ncbi:MAG TPA: RNA polymerase sigma factor RpoE [Pseudomonadales bacterium]|jgi:RNA polymerase sigma-70 factor (ECF subfamily)|nr:RNA polymerase sigma factor RpoE [Pseudomonadales bacterium]HNI37643.1 RNA polymerase sigma factor RpoE [Pseudomonadales bacterium]HNL91302.1 RNA polymerase sigma factor RpoE [Pseudomonadales bacterium]HNN86997.1 RNA polymerase sigma factor RpoE [Pseudomonadales bacterium]